MLLLLDFCSVCILWFCSYASWLMTVRTPGDKCGWSALCYVRSLRVFYLTYKMLLHTKTAATKSGTSCKMLFHLTANDDNEKGSSRFWLLHASRSFHRLLVWNGTFLSTGGGCSKVLQVPTVPYVRPGTDERKLNLNAIKIALVSKVQMFWLYVGKAIVCDAGCWIQWFICYPVGILVTNVQLNVALQQHWELHTFILLIDSESREREEPFLLCMYVETHSSRFQLELDFVFCFTLVIVFVCFAWMKLQWDQEI